MCVDTTLSNDGGKFSPGLKMEGRMSRAGVRVLERLYAGLCWVHFGRRNGASWPAFRLFYDVLLVGLELVR